VPDTQPTPDVPEPTWTIEVHDDTGDLDPDLLARVETAARAAFQAEKAGEFILSVTFLDDTAIAQLNEEYLDHEGPTDVISFPLSQPGVTPVGDVYIGVDQARRQAEEHGVPFDEEILRLTIHGALHVLGWTHDEGEASEMYVRQEEILKGIRGE
jgi:probable rRNA maturation factor